MKLITALGLSAAVLIAAPAYGQGRVDTDVRNNIDNSVTRSGNSSIDARVDLDNRNNIDMAMNRSGNSTVTVQASPDVRNNIDTRGGEARSTSDARAGDNSVSVEGSSYANSYVHEARRNPVHTAYAAPLTSGIDTCLGSASGGLQTGVVGVSFGGTKTDENCVRLKNANAAKALGMPDVACEMLATDDQFRAALARSGRACGELRSVEPAAYVPAQSEQVMPPALTDDELKEPRG